MFDCRSSLRMNSSTKSNWQVCIRCHGWLRQHGLDINSQHRPRSSYFDCMATFLGCFANSTIFGMNRMSVRKNWVWKMMFFPQRLNRRSLWSWSKRNCQFFYLLLFRLINKNVFHNSLWCHYLEGRITFSFRLIKYPFHEKLKSEEFAVTGKISCFFFSLLVSCFQLLSLQWRN